MRKLNPFQLPHVDNEPQNIPVASTSQMTSPCDDCSSLDKFAAIEPTDEPQSRVESMQTQPCSSNPDLFNIVLTEQQQNIDFSRPRQYGRRSDPVCISSFAIESSNNGAAVR